MRTAVILAKKHSGGWVMLGNPDVPLAEQNKTYRSFLLEKAHPDYCYVQIQESDGLFRRVHLRTPNAHKEHTANLDKQNAEAVAAGKLEVTEKEKRLKAHAEQRAKEHSDEIDTINKQTEADNKARAATAKAPAAAAGEAVQSTGDKPGGPTIEDWTDAGYNPAAYPPEGFAEVASPGLIAYKETGKVPARAPEVIPIIPAAGSTTQAAAQAEAAKTESPSEAPKADGETPAAPAAAAGEAQA